MFSGKHIMLSSAGLLAALALGFGFIVWPNYREASSIRRQIADLREKMEDLQGRTQALDRLGMEVSQARHRVDHDLKQIPDAADIAGLIRKLSQDVDHQTVLDQTFTAGTANDAVAGGESPMMAMPLTVDMEATFESVFALLRNAESMSRLIRVASVHVACKRDEKKPQEGAPVVRATVGLEAIYDGPAPEGKTK